MGYKRASFAIVEVEPTMNNIIKLDEEKVITS